MIRRLSYVSCACAFTLLLAPPFATPSAAGEEASESPACLVGGVDLAVARDAFAQAARLAREEGGRLWGISLAGPMLFVHPATREVVANVADREGRLAAEGGLWTGTLPLDVGVANTAVDWAGRRWTMLRWPLPDDPGDRGRLLAHEMFHRIQDDLGLTANNPVNAHLASRDGRYWLRMELRALARALEAGGEARRRAVDDALLFRAHRRGLFPGAAASENALELNEGLAEYTGLLAGGLSLAETRDAAVARLDGQDENAGSLVRSFAYATGPAYGLLLDAAGTAWRTDLGAASDLGAVLAVASGWEASAEPEGAAVRQAAAYGGAALAEVEDRRAAEHAAEQRRLRGLLVEGPRLLLPVAGGFSYTFDPGAAQVIEGVGTVFASAEVRDDWGRLIVNGGGVLLERAGGGITAVAVAAPPDPQVRPVTGSGWTLHLAARWRLVPGPRSGDWGLAEEPSAHPSIAGPPSAAGPGGAALVGRDLDVGQAAAVVDADIGKLPADAAHPAMHLCRVGHTAAVGFRRLEAARAPGEHAPHEEGAPCRARPCLALDPHPGGLRGSPVVLKQPQLPTATQVNNLVSS